MRVLGMLFFSLSYTLFEFDPASVEKIWKVILLVLHISPSSQDTSCRCNITG